MNKNTKWLCIFLWGTLIFFLGLPGNGPSLWAKSNKTSPKARLLQIEDQVMPGRLRIILKTSLPVSHRSFTMPGPNRLVIDLSPCQLTKSKTFVLKVKDPFIKGLRYTQFNPKTARIIFTVNQTPTYQISSKKGKPYQIFIDFSNIKSRIPQPIPQRTEKEILPKIPIEEFKKEKAFQDSRLKKEKALAQKPRITFDFYMSNLHNVLRLIGDVGERNILVGDEVKEKKVTLSLKEVPWDEALDSLLDSNNLKKIPRGEKTFLITTGENYKKILDDQRKEREAIRKEEQDELKTEEQRRKAPESWETRKIQIKNLDVDVVEKLIQGSIEKERKIATERGTGSEKATLTETFKVSGANVHIISAPQPNIIIARGPQKELDYIEDLIKTIDQPISQVMIEARIVEADANFTRDLGIQWGGASSFANALGPFAGTIRGTESTSSGGKNYAVNLPLASTSTAYGGLGFIFASTNLNIDVRIQAMEQQGRGKTISSPKVLTIDNKEATIKQGQSIPVTTRDPNNTYSTSYRDAALVLKVTPHISSIKKIRIKVKVEKNEPDFSKVDSLGNPTIKTKEAETEMMVTDGDTVVIGGILYKKETFQENKIPGFGDIPLLGWLFKTRSRTTEDTELLIFITPKIQKSSLSERFGNESY